MIDVDHCSRSIARLIIVAILGVVLGMVGIPNPMSQGGFTSDAALAQSRIRPRDLWRLVYEKLPDFPLENQYVSQVNGEVKPENTLALRIIRYHIYVKSRTPKYRLDWKLTLADYLGVNELMYEGVYPSADVLSENPLAGDRQAIQNLTRSQREALVDALVSLYSPPERNSD